MYLLLCAAGNLFIHSLTICTPSFIVEVGLTKWIPYSGAWRSADFSGDSVCMPKMHSACAFFTDFPERWQLFSILATGLYAITYT